MAKPKDYTIGLDIGTNSVGWVVTDDQNNILRIKGKKAIGARLFAEGKVAAERRSFRTTRRRLSRRRWRIKLLEELFDEEIAKVDPSFFARLHESWISPKDKRKRYSAIVFPSPEEDKKFHEAYPTIYHLRDKLMKDDQKHDIREIYIAVHQMIKARGNFLHDESVETYRSGMGSLGGRSERTILSVQALEELNDLFAENEGTEEVELNVASAEQINDIFTSGHLNADSQKEIGNLLLPSSFPSFDDKAKEKQVKKLIKNVATNISKAWLGYKADFSTILNLAKVDKDQKKIFAFALQGGDEEDKVQELESLLEQSQTDIVDRLIEIRHAIVLSEIVPVGMTLSEAMIDKYEQHKEDLITLKAVIRNTKDKKNAAKLQAIYDLYVNNRHADLAKAMKLTGIKKRSELLDPEELKKAISSLLDDSPEAVEIKQRLEEKTFLPLQRSNNNGVIPNQLHQVELDEIIKKQSKYYPFLAKKNPDESEEAQKKAPTKLDALLTFRVPYYVGPMITKEEQEAQDGHSFAWMVRRNPQDHKAITPWNFEEKVDKMASATQFIKRMTTKDTYLLGEDVLPASSLKYQLFTVLNELNNIRVNGKKLTSDEKEQVIEGLFKKHKTVKKRNFLKYWQAKHIGMDITVKGLSDPEKFNSTMSTYIDFKKIFGDELDDANRQNDFEKIIEYSTIFEDRKILEDKLRADFAWLSEEQIKQLCRLRLQGWGHLSDKLLTRLTDADGQNVLERLWNSTDNFGQIVSDPYIKAKIEQENQKLLRDGQSNDAVESILDDAYTSPQNKKAIRQVMRVVHDIVKACDGNVPAKFAIEFARSQEDDPKRTTARVNQMQKIYDQISDEVVSQGVKEQLSGMKSLKDRYYLYFMQGGRDAYTGEKLNIDRLSDYDIDHIMPQSFVKDDSLDNRVLVARAVNNQKSDKVPVLLFGNKVVADLGITVREMWDKWQKLGMISKRKLSNLLTDPDTLTEYRAQGFIHRQLVETSQVIKLTATILQSEFPDSKIIEVPAKYNSIVRKQFDLYKSREVNDYHHAIDAYLSTIVGNYLYQVYPNLRRMFVYGEFKKFSSNAEESAHEVARRVKSMNFLDDLLRGTQGDNIYCRSTGEIVFNRNDIISKLKQAYSFKQMLVTQEVFTRKSALFDQTVYPSPERDSKKRSGLIPRKKGMDTEIYGGYSGNKDAYFVLAEAVKEKGHSLQIVGVPIRALNTLKNSANYSERLLDIIKPQVMFNKDTGKPIKGIKDVKILMDKIPCRQPVLEGESYYMLASSKYRYSLKQISLSQMSMKYILDYVDDPNFNKHEMINIDQQDEKECLLSVYDEILEKMDKYLPLFDIRGFRKKLHDGRDAFIALPVASEEKKPGEVDVIRKILKGLHANADITNLAELGFGTAALGALVSTGGIKISDDAVFIYQSPTGLFERRVKVSDLLK
ncbi:MAG: type II CRISPR RNA-guided endonuclease Cas9 [Lactobacillus delbrueckii]|nr:type II CRISPR RNA-guided endonuclease Cas9 [Lactobacillus delbrueckii]